MDKLYSLESNTAPMSDSFATDSCLEDFNPNYILNYRSS